MVEEISELVLKKEDSVSSNEIEKRKKEVFNFFKKSKNWIYYAVLTVIVFISTYIRTRNLPKLKDITTGTWTLGPDLDPFLFLRWAQYIAEHGKLFVLDTMRFVPLSSICSGQTCNAVNTAKEMWFLSYMIAGFSKFLSLFDKQSTVTYAAVIFPVVFSVLTVVAFFLFVRKIFYKESKKFANIVALISTAFFALIPSLLPRTIAGIPEKESAAFFFIFIGLYFFMEAFTSEKLKRGLIFGVLAGIATGILGLIWGGVTFIFLIIGLTVLFEFLLGKIDKNKLFVFAVWIISFTIIMVSSSARYSISGLIVSVSTGLSFMTLFILLFDFLIFDKKIFNIHEKLKKIKLPHQTISLILALVILIILASAIFGVSFVPDMVKNVISDTVQPLFLDRFSVTVAENKQPYFTSDWAGEFGPVIFGNSNFPLYFWLFFIGSVLLFNQIVKPLQKKERRILTLSYVLFLICLIFSKYSSGSLLNGNSTISYIVYFGGVLFFVGSLFYIYYNKHKKGEHSVFAEFNFAYILYLVALTMTIIAARGAIRLIMVLGAISPVAVGFLIVKTSKSYLREKDDTKKILMGILALIIIISSIFTIWTYYNSDKSMAENYAPTMYTQQWQKAMAWVRDNTPITAVFAHWWDYGYWVQSIGERATILDGGNAIGYWNYLMGRNVLTGTNERDALDYLYAHNGTHLLIDSSDIGKYSAFSSIGSNENYDRFSSIPTVFLDDKQTVETSNETLKIYPVGIFLDEDIVLKENGKDILLPRKSAAVAAVALNYGTKGEVLQPVIFFVYNGKQYQQPLRYVYTNDKLYDFGSGIDAGLFTFARLDSNSNGGLTVVSNGAGLYLSERVIHTEFAKLYLFNDKSDYFKLVHSEDNLLIDNIKQQGANVGEFVYYEGVQGPIKIWEISYPSDMKINPAYISLDYPAGSEGSRIVKTDEYG